MNEENPWNVDSGDALRDLPWDVQMLFKPHDLKSSICLWRHVGDTSRGAHLRKYGVTIGCSACSDIAVHGKTATSHTEESRKRIGENMEHDPEGHGRLQVHKLRRDVVPEVEVDGAPPVARENDGDPAPQERQDVELEEPVKSASAKRGSDAAAADNAERQHEKDSPTQQHNIQKFTSTLRRSLQHNSHRDRHRGRNQRRWFLRHALIVPSNMVNVTLHEARKWCRGIRWLLSR